MKNWRETIHAKLQRKTIDYIWLFYYLNLKTIFPNMHQSFLKHYYNMWLQRRNFSFPQPIDSFFFFFWAHIGIQCQEICVSIAKKTMMLKENVVASFLNHIVSSCIGCASFLHLMCIKNILTLCQKYFFPRLAYLLECPHPSSVEI